MQAVAVHNTKRQRSEDTERDTKRRLIEGAELVNKADVSSEGNRAALKCGRSFLCALCGFESHVNYFGRKPPFNRGVVFLEDAFVIRNPGLGDPNRPLCLGSHCVVCERVVCAASRCSLFYTKRICTLCLKRPEVAAQVPSPPTTAKAPAG